MGHRREILMNERLESWREVMQGYTNSRSTAAACVIWDLNGTAINQRSKKYHQLFRSTM
jgi:hypothetical protein